MPHPTPVVTSNGNHLGIVSFAGGCKRSFTPRPRLDSPEQIKAEMLHAVRLEQYERVRELLELVDD